jgi:hypothetical protein
VTLNEEQRVLHLVQAIAQGERSRSTDGPAEQLEDGDDCTLVAAMLIDYVPPMPDEDDG